MKDKERIIAEVIASMGFEGFTLSDSDIARLYDCHGKPQSYYKKSVKNL